MCECYPTKLVKHQARVQLCNHLHTPLFEDRLDISYFIKYLDVGKGDVFSLAHDPRTLKHVVLVKNKYNTARIVTYN